MRVYVDAPLCPAAERTLAREGGEAGDVRVRAICLGPVEGEGRLDLAAVGANARRATEDSASVAYLGATGPANRFAEPILEEAGVAFVASGSGGPAMARILGAIEDADRDSLRDSVADALD